MLYREMVKAMQDPGAGVKLVEFGPKRGKAATKFFTGMYAAITYCIPHTTSK